MESKSSRPIESGRQHTTLPSTQETAWSPSPSGGRNTRTALATYADRRLVGKAITEEWMELWLLLRRSGALHDPVKGESKDSVHLRPPGPQAPQPGPDRRPRGAERESNEPGPFAAGPSVQQSSRARRNAPCPQRRPWRLWRTRGRGSPPPRCRGGPGHSRPGGASLLVARR